jgi:hypothetical protein
VIQTRGHRYTLEDVSREPRAPSVEVVTYDQLIRSRRVPAATYIFTDFDRLSPTDLELASLLYLQLKSAGLKVLNNPARVKKRYALLRALHDAGRNDFNVYRAEEPLPALRFPVFIRRMNGHGYPCTGLLESRHEVDRALQIEVDSGNPPEYLMIIEYAGEPVKPGLYRKLSTFRFGDTLSAFICGHDDTWLVKQGKLGIAGEDLYQDELRIVRDDPHAEQLQTAFGIANIEFGRADYGFYQGRLQVFEINTNPHIPAPAPHPSPHRAEAMKISWARIISCFHALDSAPGRPVDLPKNPKLDRHRKWRTYFHRTRTLE